MSVGWIEADWPAPRHVHAGTTSRTGGVSQDPWSRLNLAAHVGDDPAAVEENRRRLRAALGLPAEPVWLNQVHGGKVADLDAALPASVPEADAAVTTAPGRVCAVLTADCLPVVLCDLAGTCVAVAHAGWRGLANGVLEAAVAALAAAPSELIAWLGPAIGPQRFEVGSEVREVFLAADPEAASAFRANPRGRWQADLYELARRRLAGAGVAAVYGGGRCTFDEQERFFSYRRDGRCGRMATVIWLG